ncbi:imidazole glycerol phosphate synthase subunit HisF [Striga asiatica]|uniref:Imidazole glycerol phosphate synthase subunit HisF n=1 Tax=Striga asiatica TaxID=4170 RepID=A0A5A7PQF4_STRAF|nr:imidazole glycerol phosphate synthase subunit HisF [Striga asiatica]
MKEKHDSPFLMKAPSKTHNRTFPSYHQTKAITIALSGINKLNIKIIKRAFEGSLKIGQWRLRRSKQLPSKWAMPSELLGHKLLFWRKMSGDGVRRNEHG